MAERLREIIHTLEVPFEYALSGQPAQATFISLSPPTTKNRIECGMLEQAFMRSLPDASGVTEEQREAAKENADDKDPTGAEALALIAMSKDTELSEVMEVARKLFLSGVATIEGETKVVSLHLDRMDLDDFKELVGKYLVGFILRSALESQKLN